MEESDLLETRLHADGSPSSPAAVEGPGALGRIVGVFLNPRRTFESMRERPRFLLALIVVLVVQTILALVLYQSGVIAEQTVAKMEEQGRNPQEIEAVEAFFAGPLGFVTSVATAPFVVTIGMIIGAAFLFFMGNLMLGAKLRFAHYLSAIAFAGVVQIVDQVVRVALSLANRTFDVRLGLGMLFGDASNMGVRALDMATDPLFLWGNLVCAIGVSTYARRGLGFGLITVIPGFLLAVFLGSNR
jgi:hypothetical protein